MGLPEGTESLWAELASDEGRALPGHFDPDSLGPLPAPASRWLSRVVPAGTALVDTVELSMTGQIKIGRRWMPLSARQILRAGVGFVWKPVVGGRLLRFVGADLLGPDDARMEFRLWGLVAVAKASGVDTARSAAGRLAAETVAWLPQAATPQAGARWHAVDDETAVVTLDAAGETVDVRVTVDSDGRLHSLALQRWNSASEPPGFESFGGAVTGEHTGPGGVRVVGSGSAGWGYGTAAAADGEFFRYEITGLEWIAPG